jgi:hypothetical protein
MEKKTAMILGGAAVAGLGLYLWQKSKTASAATPQKPAGADVQSPRLGTPTVPVSPNPTASAPTDPIVTKPAASAPTDPAVTKPAIPSPTASAPTVPVVTVPTPTPAATVPAPAGVSFNEMTPDGKLQLWTAVTKGTLKTDTSNSNFYVYDATPAKTLDESGSMILMQRNDAQGGDALYILASVSNSEAPVFWAAAESDAVAMASGPSAAWTVFLRPNEWRTMAENAWSAGQTSPSGSTSSVPSTGSPALDQFGQGLQGQLSQAASQADLPSNSFNLGSFKL